MLDLFRSKKTLPIAVGARYSSGETPSIVWEVASLFLGIDGTPYAQIIHVADATRRKTLAQSVLEQGSQFHRL